MLLLFAAQGPGSAGLIAATTVNAIVGADLTGQPALAGLPSATYIFDGAFAQLVMTMVMVITFPAMVGAVASLAPLLLTLW